MANRLTKTGTLTYQPAVHPVEARPAYCVSGTITEVTRIRVNGTDFGPGSPTSGSGTITGHRVTSEGIEAGGSQYSLTFLSEPLPTGGSGRNRRQPTPEYRERYTTRYVRHCYPAIEAVPGHPARVVDLAASWSGGANSVRLLSGDGYMSFQVPSSPVGVVVGFSPTNNTTALAEATHAFYADGPALKVLERGSVKATVVGIDLEADPVLFIRRVGSTVTYGVPSVGWAYTSELASSGPVFMDAALFATNDYVDNPTIGATAELTGGEVLPLPINVSARIGRVYYADATRSVGWSSTPGEAIAITRLGIRTQVRALVGGKSFEWVTTGLGIDTQVTAAVSYAVGVSVDLGIRATVTPHYERAILPAWLSLSGDYAYAESQTTLPAWTGAADGSLILPSPSGSNTVIPPWGGSALMYSGTVSTVESDLPAWVSIASEGEYSDAQGVLPAWFAWGFDRWEAPGYQSWIEPVWMADWFIKPARVYATFDSSVDISDSFAAVITVIADFMDGIQLSADWSLSRVLSAAIQDGVAFSSGTDGAELEAIQYALNLGTGGVSRYTGYEFSGYCSTDTATYAWDNDKLYLLGGDSDDGTAISGTVDLGQLPTGTLMSSHMEGVYLGIATDGTVYARITADGKPERVYRAVQRGRSTRVNTGKGVTARKWNVSFEIVDASHVELDSIQFVLNAAARRWVK